MHHFLGVAVRSGFRAVLEPHEHRHLGAQRAAVELDRLVAAAFEEQVGLDLHGVSISGIWG
jgi:hypothetical protein